MTSEDKDVLIVSERTVKEAAVGALGRLEEKIRLLLGEHVARVRAGSTHADSCMSFLNAIEKLVGTKI